MKKSPVSTGYLGPYGSRSSDSGGDAVQAPTSTRRSNSFAPRRTPHAMTDTHRKNRVTRFRNIWLCDAMNQPLGDPTTIRLLIAGWRGDPFQAGGICSCNKFLQNPADNSDSPRVDRQPILAMIASAGINIIEVSHNGPATATELPDALRKSPCMRSIAAGRIC